METKYKLTSLDNSQINSAVAIITKYRDVFNFDIYSSDTEVFFESNLDNVDAVSGYFLSLGCHFKVEKITSETNHPPRYNQYPIETIDMMEKIWGKEAVKQWCVMTAFKYRMRIGHKDAIEQELEKERWYLERSKN